MRTSTVSTAVASRQKLAASILSASVNERLPYPKTVQLLTDTWPAVALHFDTDSDYVAWCGHFNLTPAAARSRTASLGGWVVLLYEPEAAPVDVEAREAIACVLGPDCDADTPIPFSIVPAGPLADEMALPQRDPGAALVDAPAPIELPEDATCTHSDARQYPALCGEAAGYNTVYGPRCHAHALVLAPTDVLAAV